MPSAFHLSNAPDLYQLPSRLSAVPSKYCRLLLPRRPLHAAMPSLSPIIALTRIYLTTKPSPNPPAFQLYNKHVPKAISLRALKSSTPIATAFPSLRVSIRILPRLFSARPDHSILPCVPARVSFHCHISCSLQNSSPKPSAFQLSNAPGL